MRRAPLAICVVVLGVGTAFAQDAPRSQVGNLDFDAAREQVTIEDITPEGTDPYPFTRTERIRLTDVCAEGEISEYVDEPKTGAEIESLRLLRADTRPGREILVHTFSYGYEEDATVLLAAWRERTGAPCRRVRHLFRYPAESAEPPPSRATSSKPYEFEAELDDFATRYAGKEIRLREYWHREGDDSSYPTLVRETGLRYHAKRDRYIRYHRSVYKRTVITI